MATNQTNVHKKMDTILRKLETLADNDKAIAKQTNYLAQLVQLAKQDSQATLARISQQTDNLAQLVVLAKQDSQRQHQEAQAMARDMAQILLEVKKSSDETAKRVAELLGERRKH